MTLEMKLDQRFEDGMETLTNVVLRLRKGESVEQLRKEGIEEEVIEKALTILE